MDLSSIPYVMSDAALRRKKYSTGDPNTYIHHSNDDSRPVTHIPPRAPDSVVVLRTPDEIEEEIDIDWDRQAQEARADSVVPSSYNYSLYGSSLRQKHHAFRNDFTHNTKLIFQQTSNMYQMEQRSNELTGVSEEQEQMNKKHARNQFDDPVFFPIYLANYNNRHQHVLMGGNIDGLDRRKTYHVTIHNE